MGYAAAGLVVALIGTGASYAQGEKAAKVQKNANKMRQRAQELAAARERRKQVQEARQIRAQLVARNQASGTSQSTSAVQGLGGVNTQLQSNLSFLDTSTQLSAQESAFNQEAASRQSRAANYQAIGSVGYGAFQDFGGYKSLFGT